MTKKIKLYVSVTILLFINFVFSYKYLQRYSEYGAFIAWILLALQVLVFKFRHKIRLSKSMIQIGGIIYAIFVLALIVLSHIYIPVESLSVDRWSVISSFIDEFISGNYPYYAQSHLGNYPGPMPIYFLIASPFYWIGELSLLSGLGYFIMIYLLLEKGRKEELNFVFIFFTTSLFIVWEITTRSNVFSYSMLVLLVLQRFTKLSRKEDTSFYITAIMTGLMLSTRSVFILAYIVFFVSNFIRKEFTFRRLLVFVLVAMLSFFATFAPFVVLYDNDFFTMNPFIIQSSFLIPKIYTILFMVISVVFSFFVKDLQDKFFYSGVSLFIAILIYALFHIVKDGFEVAYLGSIIDVSYFIFCVPFLMKFVLNNTKRISV